MARKSASVMYCVLFCTTCTMGPKAAVWAVRPVLR